MKKAGQTNFGLWTEEADVDLATLKTVKSAKDAFFPQSETLYTCQRDGKTLPCSLKSWTSPSSTGSFDTRPSSPCHTSTGKGKRQPGAFTERPVRRGTAVSLRELGGGGPFPGRQCPERLTGSDLQVHWPLPGPPHPSLTSPREPYCLLAFLTSHSDPAWPWSSAAAETC